MGTKVKDFKPYMSLGMIILTLILTVFFQMESRRLGYEALKQNQIMKELQAEFRGQSIQLAKVVRHDRIKYYAMSRLTLEQARKGQIIQMTGDKIAVAY